MFEHTTGCIPTSSMGRLFDAVSSLLDVRHLITFEGQAAIELEHLAAAWSRSVPTLRFILEGDKIGAAVLIADVVGHRRDGIPPAALAAAFHEAVAVMVCDVAQRVSAARRLTTVGLTGGVFQNAHLVVITRRKLENAGFSVLIHRRVPPNDGGLALGQAIIAGHRGSNGRP